jgi:hypothetical protein
LDGNRKWENQFKPAYLNSGFKHLLFNVLQLQVAAP